MDKSKNRVFFEYLFKKGSKGEESHTDIVKVLLRMQIGLLALNMVIQVLKKIHKRPWRADWKLELLAKLFFMMIFQRRNSYPDKIIIIFMMII